MRLKGKKKKPRGINIEVSIEAHALMLEKAKNAKPKRTLREHVNIMNRLPKDI